MKESKISIIVVANNVEKYLVRCLDSVLAQTFKDWNIVCINDGSTDNTKQILDTYASKNPRIIAIHKDYNGVSVARNIGLDNADAEYITFLDSDDTFVPTALEDMYNAINEQDAKDVDFITTQTNIVPEDPENPVTAKRANEMIDYMKIKDFGIKKIELDNFSESIAMTNCVVWGKLYKKDFITKNNLRFMNENIIHEDNGFFLKILACFPTIKTIKNFGVNYLIRTTSITGKLNQKPYRKKAKKDLKKSVFDACNFIKNKYTNNKRIARKLIFKIKISNTYARLFGRSFLRLKFTENYSKLKIFGITICKIKRQ